MMRRSSSAPTLVEGLERVQEDDVSALHVQGPRPGRPGPLSHEAAALQHRVEVTDQEEPLAHLPFLSATRCPARCISGGISVPARLEPEPIELRAEDFPDLPHPFEVLGGAVDVDDAFEELDRLLAEAIDEVRDATLLGREFLSVCGGRYRGHEEREEAAEGPGNRPSADGDPLNGRGAT